METLTFTPAMLERPAPSGIYAITTLRHFAIVTYALPPERLRPLVHPRFELDCVEVDGGPKALLSVVPFEGVARFPPPRTRATTRLAIRTRPFIAGSSSLPRLVALRVSGPWAGTP